MRRSLSLLAILFLAVPAFAATTYDTDWLTVETNAWVVQVHVKNLSTGGTYVYGLGASNDFSGGEGVRITLNSPGYDDTGASNYVTRTVVGTKRLRKPYSNQAVADEVTDASGVILRVALSDVVHANDTITSVTVSNGFYTQAGNLNLATNFTSITNKSRSNPPRVLAMWSQPGVSLVGSNYTVRLVAFHYSAQQGRPVRAVQFWAKDSAGHVSPTNTVLKPTIDRTQGDAEPVIEYIGTIDGSGFNQGTTISNYATIYPWYGPAQSFDDGTNGLLSADYAPLITFCNKSGDWRQVWAIVDPTNGVNATAKAVTNLTQATDGTAKPYLTIADAINACGATNSAVNGTNAYSACFVWCTNGSYAIFGGPNVTSRGNNGPWLTIGARPDVDGSKVFFSSKNNSFTIDKDVPIHLTNFIYSVSSFANGFDQGYGRVWLDHCEMWTNNNDVAAVGSYTNLWVTQCTYRGLRNMANPSANQVSSWVKYRGCTMYSFDTVDGRSCIMQPALFIGNKIVPNILAEQYSFVNDSLVTIDPGIWAFNYLGKHDDLSYAATVGINANLTKGFVFAQNAIETVSHSGTSIPWDVMNSNRDHEYSTNILSWNNTILINEHPPYNLLGFQDVTLDHFQDLNNIVGGLQMKADVGDVNVSDTNRWQRMFSVGCFGNASANYAQTFTQPGGNELGFDGVKSWFFSATNAAAFKFVNNAGEAAGGGGSAAGLGDYNLKTAHDMNGLRLNVVLPYDLAGNARGEIDPPGAYASASVRKGGGFF